MPKIRVKITKDGHGSTVEGIDFKGGACATVINKFAEALHSESEAPVYKPEYYEEPPVEQEIAEEYET